MEAGLRAMLRALQLVGAAGPVVEWSVGSGSIRRGFGRNLVISGQLGYGGTSCGGGATLGDEGAAKRGPWSRLVWW